MRVLVIGDRAHGLDVWRRRLDDVRVHVGGAARVGGGGARRKHVQTAIVAPSTHIESRRQTLTHTDRQTRRDTRT